MRNFSEDFIFGYALAATLMCLFLIFTFVIPYPKTYKINKQTYIIFDSITYEKSKTLEVEIK